MSSELDTILSRLKLCHDDIGTITRSEKEPPREIAPADLPLVYCINTGVSDSPSSPSGTVQVFTFAVEVLVKFITEKTVNASTISQAVVSTHAIIDDVMEYYREHRRLSTNSLADLNLYTDSGVPGIRFSCEGLVLPLSAHDGKDYIGTRFQISVPMLIDT